MKTGATFYVSRVLNNRVYDRDRQVIGRVKDFVVDDATVRPRVIAIKVRTHDGIRFLDFEQIRIEKIKKQYHITCNEAVDRDFDEAATFLLVKHVLDKQLIDIDGRKVVRVNDLRLAVLSLGTFLVAVDVGFEGLLRRLAMAKPLKKALKPFGWSIPSQLLLWDEVEGVEFSSRGIRLTKTSERLSTMHPSDLADILEELDRKNQLEIFSSLDEETALDVLEELDPDAQANVVKQLPVETSAAMLEKMPTDEAADILEELDDISTDQILDAMEAQASVAIRALMEYPEDSVGSLMTTDFFAFEEQTTVEHVIEILRQVKPDSDSVYYLYVVSDTAKLTGILSLRDLIVSSPKCSLSELANRNVIYVNDTDDTEVLADIVAKYNLLAVPVVNNAETLVGVVTINDVVHNLQRARRGRF